MVQNRYFFEVDFFEDYSSNEAKTELKTLFKS